MQAEHSIGVNYADSAASHRGSLRHRHRSYLQVLRASSDWATIEQLMEKTGQSRGSAIANATGLNAAGLLLHWRPEPDSLDNARPKEAAKFKTSAQGEQYSMALGHMLDIFDMRHAPAELPSVLEQMDRYIPLLRTNAVLEYNEKASGASPVKMIHRSDINIIHSMLSTMASGFSASSDIRRASRFDYSEVGRQELRNYLDLLLELKLIERGYHGVETYGMTRVGRKIYDSLDVMTKITGR